MQIYQILILWIGSLAHSIFEIRPSLTQFFYDSELISYHDF